MSRRIVASITAALALAPLTAFAADSAPSRQVNCDCSQVSAKSTASSSTAKPAPVNSSQGAPQAELERIWSASP